MTRLLVVSPYYAPAWRTGGVARTLAEWNAATAACGVDIHVYTTTADVDTELAEGEIEPSELHGVHVTYFPRWRASGNRFFSPKLVHACLNNVHKFDVVHAANLWNVPSLAATICARRARVPVVLSLHGAAMTWALAHHRYRKRLGRLLLQDSLIKQAHTVVCSTEMERRAFDSLQLGVPVTVIHNVVNTLRGGSETTDSVASPDGSLTILFASRVVENKGLALSVEAFSRIATKFPLARFVVMGHAQDNSLARVMRTAEERGILSRIVVLGHQEDKAYADVVRKADVFVLHSKSENFGNSIAEAMSVGVPVLISDQVGIADLVSQYGAGIVSRRTVDDIAPAFETLLSDAHLRREMGGRGKQLVRERFAPSTIGQQWADTLRTISAHQEKPERSGHSRESRGTS